MGSERAGSDGTVLVAYRMLGLCGLSQSLREIRMWGSFQGERCTFEQWLPRFAAQTERARRQNKPACEFSVTFGIAGLRHASCY